MVGRYLKAVGQVSSVVGAIAAVLAVMFAFVLGGGAIGEHFFGSDGQVGGFLVGGVVCWILIVSASVAFNDG